MNIFLVILYNFLDLNSKIESQTVKTELSLQAVEEDCHSAVENKVSNEASSTYTAKWLIPKQNLRHEIMYKLTYESNLIKKFVYTLSYIMSIHKMILIFQWILVIIYIQSLR